MTEAVDPVGLVLGGALVVALFAYLLAVLIHPERF
jgi:K+-transporting ATPase KdpF subunit